MARRIDLHIDQITLRGGDALDKRALVVAIEAHLREALAAPGAAEALGQGHWSSRVDAGRVQTLGADSKALGKAVAGATLQVLCR